MRKLFQFMLLVRDNLPYGSNPERRIREELRALGTTELEHLLQSTTALESTILHELHSRRVHRA